MIEAKCDCGAVRIEVETAPEAVFDCRCDWCQRTGAIWAYYHSSQVRLVCEPDATMVYQRAKKRLDFHFCRTCGLLAYWDYHDRVQGSGNMGINSRLMDRGIREAAELRVIGLA